MAASFPIKQSRVQPNKNLVIMVNTSVCHLQFHLNPLEVGLLFSSAPTAFLVTTFLVGPLSDRLASIIP
jgi:hypothetical protein